MSAAALHADVGYCSLNCSDCRMDLMATLPSCRAKAHDSVRPKVSPLIAFVSPSGVPTVKLTLICCLSVHHLPVLDPAAGTQ